MIFGFLSKLVLSPVLIVQALLVIKRALRLPEASGARAGILGDGPSLRVLIVGDSSAAGVGVSHQDDALAGQLTTALAQDFTLTWRLLAQTGATTASTLKTLDGAALDPCDIIVTALGVNDIARSVPLRRWRRQQRQLRETLRVRTGARHIYVTGIPPIGEFPLLPQPLRWVLGRNARRAGELLQADLEMEADATYVTLPHDMLTPALMAEDGYHPGPEIYALWGTQMASRILSDWPEISSDAVGLSAAASPRQSPHL